VTKLTLTGAANLKAVGNNLGDVITANNGNDLLVGGTGNDTLIGGAGLDTFAMGRGMGNDIVIDTSTKGGAVLLDAGMSLSDLKLTRQGDNLQIQIIGSTDSMSIKDYYLNPQTAWTIVDRAGQTASPQDLAAPSRYDIVQLEKNFIAQIKQTYGTSQQWTINDGWYSGGIDQLEITTRYTGQSLDIQHNVSYLNGATFSYVDRNSSIYPDIQMQSGTTTTIQQIQISADAPVIYATATTTLNITTDGIKWASANPRYLSFSTPDLSAQTSITRTVPVADSGGKVIGYDQQVITPNSGLAGFRSWFWEADGYQLSSTSVSSPYTSMQNMRVAIVHDNVTEVIEQVNIGAGNHTVYGDSTTVVNSGSGNNVIMMQVLCIRAMVMTRSVMREPCTAERAITILSMRQAPMAVRVTTR